MVAVLAAGTSDLPVAEEAAVCAAWFGHEVERCYDVGIAGLHRLLGNLPAIRKADVVVAVAGMDGALPTVVAGLVTAPGGRGADQRGLRRELRRRSPPSSPC